MKKILMTGMVLSALLATGNIYADACNTAQKTLCKNTDCKTIKGDLGHLVCIICKFGIDGVTEMIQSCSPNKHNLCATIKGIVGAKHFNGCAKGNGSGFTGDGSTMPGGKDPSGSND